MFLRSKGFGYPGYINISKRLLSNEIREVLNTRLESPNGTQLQLSVVSKNLNALNLDLFVNNISQHEDRRSAILDLLANLRATKFANTCLESTQFGVVRHLLENSSIQEVVPVLMDRPQYGIFLNNFTGFAVTQSLHNEKEFILGLPLALKLVLLDELSSEFVQGYCLKSSLETLKKELFGEQSTDDKALSPPKGKIIEKKIRVKYLRNYEEPNQHNEIGKSILKIESKILEGNTKENAKILGLVLTANYDKLDKFLSEKSIKIFEDIAGICKELLSRANKVDLVNKFERIESKTSFGDLIDDFLKKAYVKEAAELAEKQKQLIPIWQQLRSQKKVEIEEEIAKKEKIENIENIKNQIATQKELLWFFNNEENLDLEIYNKRVFYPKRWFGKKKKPRVVDEHYVPPQIRKIN